MSILNILQYPDFRLRRKGYKVENVKSKKIQTDIANIIETLLAQKSCAGLAATQLDIEEPPNITVINLGGRNPKKDDLLCLINLEILSATGEIVEEEACMSVCPGKISAEIKRAKKVQVRALDIRGKKIEFEAQDYFARCIQHEYDHLQGVVYIDHLPKAERLKIEIKLAN